MIALSLLLSFAWPTHASKMLMFALSDQPTRPPTEVRLPFCDGALDRDAFVDFSKFDSNQRYQNSRALLDLFTGLVLSEGTKNPTTQVTELAGTMRLRTPNGQVFVADARANDEIFVYDLARASVLVTRISRVHRIADDAYELTIDQ